jgi:hypothetical protein
VQIEGNYSTEAACLVDGANGEFTMPPGTGTGGFYCEQGEDGLYYLYFSN